LLGPRPAHVRESANAVRPYVLGRQNCTFNGNKADASWRVVSLMETTKLNHWKPCAYLNELLGRLPVVPQIGQWESLLLWSLSKPAKD